MSEIRELPEGARQPLTEGELTLEQLAEGFRRLKRKRWRPAAG